MKILQNAVSTDVLSICVCGKYLFVGEASNLTVYDSTENKALTSVKLFLCSSVHQIKRCNNSSEEFLQRLLVFGGKSLTFALFNTKTSSLKYNSEIIVGDWIIDASLSKDDLSLFVATAHNTLTHYSVSPSMSEQTGSPRSLDLNELYSPKERNNFYEFIERKQCTETSILYCGQIVGDDWDSCVVLSGTAFGKILVWAPWALLDNTGKNSLISSISGPKGTIFSVSYNEDNKLIGATADDRSFRIWKLCSQSKNSINHTKFTDEQLTWINCDFTEIFCSFGHFARVWKSLILDHETSLSSGEDSIVCIWSNSGFLKAQWTAHPASNVWCLAYSEGLIFTGSGGGSVKKWPLNIHCDREKPYSILLPVEFAKNSKMKKSDLKTGVLNNYIPKKEKQFPRSINLVDHDTMIIVTNDGSLWMYRRNSESWKRVFQHNYLKNYVKSCINKESTLLALGTLSGHIIIIKLGSWQCVCLHEVFSNKIQALFIENDILIACNGFGEIQIWFCKFEDEMEDFHLLKKYILPECRQRWITSACFLNSDTKENLSLVVGNTRGSILLFKDNVKEDKNLKCILKGLHGRNGVTSIKRNKDLIITAGRDGCIRYLQEQNNELKIIYEFKLSFCTWISGILKFGSEMIALAFSDMKLQLWNVSEDQMITELHCGGGHRTWDFVIGSKRLSNYGDLEETAENNETLITCAFLKDGIPFMWNSALPKVLSPTIKCSSSGRQIQCLEPIMWFNDGVIFSFGGEDTLLHVSVLLNGEILKLSQTKSHLSSIRCLEIIRVSQNDNTGKIYLVSSGGRAQIKVWEMNLDKARQHNLYRQEDIISKIDDLKVLLCDIFDPIIPVKEVASFMLNPESDHSWKKTYHSLDPETRFMDTMALWITEDVAFFILNCSDGFIRFFRFTLEGSFEMVYSEDCHFCLLRLCSIKMSESNLIIASTTRGNILIWELTVLLRHLRSVKSDEVSESVSNIMYEPAYNYKVHNCGLNSLSPNVQIHENAAYLCAGGDDGSIDLLKFHFDSKGLLKNSLKISRCNRVCLHSGQVSGMVWLDKSRLCSVSIDQRLIIWQIERDHLTPTTVYFSSIPDIQGIKFLRKETMYKMKKEEDKIYGKIFVYGAGIEVFDIK